MLLTELRHAARAHRRAPAFALAALATLALGIGANAAMFSVVNGVLLRPLPYPGAERVVQLLTGRAGDSPDASFAPANYLDVAAGATTFDALAGYREAALDLAIAGRDPQRLVGAFTTPRYFDVFGIVPVAGRLYDASNRPGGARVSVLSESAWRRLFGADEGIIGRVVHLGGQAYTVLGVAPAAMTWPSKVDVWVLADRAVPPPPLEVKDDYLAQRGLSYFNVVGRLREGISLDTASAELRTIAARLAHDHPENNASRTIDAVPLRDRLVSDVRPALLALFAAVGVVLLIATANVAHLRLARAAVRGREFAIRSALGASTGRLLRQLLIEGLVLGSCGGALGLALGLSAVRLLVALAPADLPRLDEVQLDWRVLGFTALVSLVAAVLFGLAPILQARRIDLVEALKAGGRAGSAGQRVTRRALVVAEVALATVLVVGAGLLLHSFWRLSHVDPGFQQERLVAIDLPIPESRYDTVRKQADFYRAFVERLSVVPTVRSAAAGFPRPFGDGTDSSAPFEIEGRPAGTARNRPMALLGIATPGYFQTLGIPRRAGRDFTEDDTDARERVVVVNEALARRHFPGESPLDRRINIGGNDQWWRIVGVVGDHRSQAPGRAPEPTVFLSYRQFALPFLTAYARTTGDPERIASEARSVLRGLDREFALQDVREMSAVVGDAVAVPRFRTMLIAFFAALAITLAALGIYGVVTYSAAQRVREFGIRLALGATPGDLRALTVRDGLQMTALGLLLGLAGGWIMGRVIGSMLFEVRPADPITYTVAPLLLAGVSVLASLRPAQRAARVDPAVTLRTE